MNPFTYFQRPTEAWFYAGPASSFPDIDPDVDGADLSQPRQSACAENGRAPGCKAFNVSREDGAKGEEVAVQSGALEWDEDGDSGKELKDQVMVFRYRGKFHAVDHVSIFPILPRFFLLHKVTDPSRNARTPLSPCQKARHSTLRILASS